MPKALTISCIGAGNIAHHLVPALVNVGCDIQCIYSRKLARARVLADLVDSKATSGLSRLPLDSDLYLIMVPDDVIEQVVSQLPKIKNNSIIAHTAGAVGISILKGRTNNYGSFYPLQSFKKNIETDLSKTPFLINANNKDSERTLRSLARVISSQVSLCSDQDRLKYHLAAVFVNNYINHLACITNDFLEVNNLNPEYIQAIKESTFEKILNSDPCSIQTGPAIRKDVKLQRKHLKLLKECDNWSKVYKAISDSIKNTYHENR